MVASTATMGVVALPMPASAELIRVSDRAKSVNGSAPRKNPQTTRCPHTRPPVGSRPPREKSSTLTTAAPDRMRRPEICTAESDSSPTFMSRKLEPQMSTSARYLTCQGTRGCCLTPPPPPPDGARCRAPYGKRCGPPPV